MNIQTVLAISGFFGYGAQGLSCLTCNYQNPVESCGPPLSCKDIVPDVCGCCPVCAKLEGELCGGSWDMLGRCADGFVCHPISAESPHLGAGGYYLENWSPAGTCIDPYKYQREHSPCLQLLAEYDSFLKTRERDSTNDRPATATNQTGTIISDCRRKPFCTPEGNYTPLQCDGCSGECWCALLDGQEIGGTRGLFHTVRC